MSLVWYAIEPTIVSDRFDTGRTCMTNGIEADSKNGACIICHISNEHHKPMLCTVAARTVMEEDHCSSLLSRPSKVITDRRPLNAVTSLLLQL